MGCREAGIKSVAQEPSKEERTKLNEPGMFMKTKEEDKKLGS
jgi:hypothetical protein